MNARLRKLGLVLAAAGLVFVAAGGFAFFKAQQGYSSLQAFSAAQNVKLNYNDEGQLVDRGETAGAEAIMSLLTNDWGYAVDKGDLNPNDPLVNTPTEYMYQMATITYHIISGTQTVVFAEDVKAANGDIIPAGSYEFKVDGRYYADFNRANPIEGAARGQAWSATALGLIGELGTGTTTASALQLALAMAALLAGIGLAVSFTGLGLIWVSAARVPVPTESVSTAPAITPGIAPAPVAR